MTIMLYKRIKTIEDCKQLQGDLDRISNWVGKHGMKINAKKSQLIRYTIKKQKVNYEYKVGKELLAEDLKCKYLGIKINNSRVFCRLIYLFGSFNDVSATAIVAFIRLNLN